ncbi:COG4223 family protein [Sphingomonas sp. PR090111-T3T-6A]|uniref:COG4223 family protein n=1 Tax=Sphingomonas sp. PR090111-T3T-6A TaxID=685778 RepID=UPI00037B5958|nr:hypothetical protein [Sphingomonas sp. PR090111-T3T-6A]
MERDYDPYERRSRAWLWALLLVLAAFVGGAFAMGYAVTHDARTARMLHLQTIEQAQAQAALAQHVVVRPPPPAQPAPAGTPSAAATDPQMATRITTLEDKVDDIEAQAREATGDASRAEGLLVTFAARRALDRGVELGYLEGLLRQRFGNTQPQAVATILSAARQPVTLVDLQNGLDAIAPTLSASGVPQKSWWQSFRHELSGLVVVRRSGEPSTVPADRVARAGRRLEAGQVDAALAEIARLPDHRAADSWIVAARRYLSGRAALDQIETAALLDPGTPRSQPGASGWPAAPQGPHPAPVKPAAD